MIWGDSRIRGMWWEYLYENDKLEEPPIRQEVFEIVDKLIIENTKYTEVQNQNRWVQYENLEEWKDAKSASIIPILIKRMWDNVSVTIVFKVNTLMNKLMKVMNEFGTPPRLLNLLSMAPLSTKRLKLFQNFLFFRYGWIRYQWRGRFFSVCRVVAAPLCRRFGWCQGMLSSHILFHLDHS